MIWGNLPNSILTKGAHGEAASFDEVLSNRAPRHRLRVEDVSGNIRVDEACELSAFIETQTLAHGVKVCLLATFDRRADLRNTLRAKSTCTLGPETSSTTQ